MTHASCRALFEKARDKVAGKPIGTGRERMRIVESVFNPGSMCVNYYGTTLVRFNPDGSAVLNSGGWRTPATKERIGWILAYFGAFVQGKSFYVQQEDFEWFLGFYNHRTQKHVRVCRFYDGLKLDKRGNVVNIPKHARLSA